MTLTDLEMSVQAIAPDYQNSLVTIRDRYQVETRWMIPAGQKMDSTELEKLTDLHVRFSQGQTRRN